MPAPAPRTPAKSSKPLRPRRLYAGSIVALAIFVIGTMFWRSPVAGHRADAKILYRSSAAKSIGPDGKLVNRSLTLDQVAEQIRLPETIQCALTAAFAADSSHGDPASSIDDGQIAAVRDYVAAEGVADETGGLYRVTISYVDQEADAAVQLVNAVADTFVAQCDRQDTAVRDELERQLDAVRTQTELARERAHAATSEKNDLLAASSQTAATERSGGDAAVSIAAPTRNNEVSATADLNPAQPLNPDWVRLRDHIGQLESRQAALSATRTDAHPEMQEVAAEIGQFAAILQRTPKYLGPELEPPGPDGPFGGPAIESFAAVPGPSFPVISPELAEDDSVTAPPRQPSDADHRTPQEDIVARVAALDTVIESAREEVTRGEQQVDELRQQIKLASQPRAQVDVRARASRRLGGALTTDRVLQLLGVSLAIGLLVALATPVTRSNRVLQRPADAEQQLGIPVIGAISTGQAVPSTTPVRRDRPVRRMAVRAITAAAELSLIAVVVVFLAAALLDRSLAATYLSDPMHVLSQTLDLTKQRLLGG